ncbi:unnamed protein product, partial [Meganyctiphanes norvegica]
MSDIGQDCYRNLLHRYFDIEEKTSAGKSLDKVLSKLDRSLVSSGKQDEVNLTFIQYRDDCNVEGLFKYFWNLEEAQRSIHFDIISSEKCRELSILLLNDANRFLTRKLYPQSLDLINLSLMYAPHPALSDSEDSSDEESITDEESISSSTDSTSPDQQIANKLDEDDGLINESTDETMKLIASNNQHNPKHATPSKHDVNHNINNDDSHDFNCDFNHDFKHDVHLDVNLDDRKDLNNEVDHIINYDINHAVNCDTKHAVNQDVKHDVNQDVKHDEKHDANSDINHDINHVDYRILGMSYSKRAKLLFELNQYEKSLMDINRATEFSYTGHMPLDLFELKKKCITAIQTKQENGWKKSLQTLDDIEFSDMTTEESITKMRSIMKQFCNNKSLGYINQINVENMEEEDLIFAYDNPVSPDLEEVNPAIPSLSSAVKIEYSPEKGRHTVAARDIKPGEIVAVEKAYNWTVDIMSPTASATFCRSCLSRTAAPIPCPNCHKVVFCSDECREIGLSTLHRIECGMIPTMVEIGSFALPRVFSIISQIPFIELKTRVPTLRKEVHEKHRQYHGFDENSVYDSEKYQSVYHMEGNFTKRTVNQLLHLCTVSFIMVKMLIESKQYFIDETGCLFEPTESDIVLVGSVCLDHICKVLCNSAEIDEYQVKIDEKKDGHDTMKIGSGIFPAICLMNHSCNPSTMINSYGTMAVCHAVKFIAAGEDVTYTYNMTYYNHELSERQKETLDHYHFSCECEACLGNWKVKISDHKLSSRKLIKQIDEDPKSDIYKEKVKEIEKQMHIIKKKFHKVAMDLKENKRESHVHLDTIIDTLEFFDKYVELPNHIHFLAQRY